MTAQPTTRPCRRKPTTCAIESVLTPNPASGPSGREPPASPIHFVLTKPVLSPNAATRPRSRKSTTHPIHSVLPKPILPPNPTTRPCGRKIPSMHRNPLVVVVAEPRHLRPAVPSPTAALVPSTVARTTMLEPPVVHLVAAVRPVAAFMEQDAAADPVQPPRKKPERHPQKRVNREA